MTSVAYELDTVPVELTEKGRSQSFQEKPLPASAEKRKRIENFRLAKQNRYGNNYEKFVGLYEMVAEELRPSDFEMLIDKVYVQYHREELFSLVINPYTTEQDFGKFQDRLFKELKDASFRMQKMLTKQEYADLSNVYFLQQIR